MMPLARIVKDYDEAGALNSVVNLYGFADDHVFLTKSGDVGVVLALDGVDYECLDPDQREAVTRRFEIALRVLDESMRLSQYVLKRNRVAVPHTPSTDPVVDALLSRRQQWLEAKGADLYTLQLYAVVLAESRTDTQTSLSRLRSLLRAPLGTIREWLSTRRTVVRLDDEIERLRRRLLHKVDAFVAQLQDTVRPRVLPKEDAFQFFRQLLNYDPAKAGAVRLREDTFLDYHAGDATLECHRSHLRLDDHHVRVLTLKEPPAQTFPHLFQALYEIPSNLILMNDWRREGQAAIRKIIHAKRRHFHNARVSLTSYLGETPTAPSDLLVDDSAAAVVKDLGACLTEMTLHGRYAGDYTMTVVLYDTDPASLDRSVAACTKAFAAHDAQVTDERINLLNAWLAVLPGNSAYNLRSMYLLNTNYADLACLFSQDAGSATNPHLGRESLAVLETTQATLYHVNLHVDDVAHTLVLGATGSGKSFFLNFLIAQLQRYAPRTMIFDLGGSYDGLTRHFEGTALRLGLDRRDVTINPFCLPPTPANLHFLFGFVKVLIQSGGQYTLTVADDRDLYEQIEAFYTIDPDQRRLFTLTTTLRKPLALPLQRWVQGGPYASLFDHVEDTLTVSRFQYVDFEGLDAYPQLLEPLLFYLLHRADAAMADPSLAGTLKVFVLDEAWRFLRDPTIRQYVTEALKTWRKKNACVLLATQSSEDLARSELLRVAIESCPTKCFLANPHIDRAVYQELFHLNETEAELIEKLVARQQVLLKRPDHAKVLNLTVDPETERLFRLRSRH
jgi:type IV secretion/conjugal transfer VirB4 family ATPase